MDHIQILLDGLDGMVKKKDVINFLRKFAKENISLTDEHFDMMDNDMILDISKSFVSAITKKSERTINTNVLKKLIFAQAYFYELSNDYDDDKLKYYISIFCNAEKIYNKLSSEINNNDETTFTLNLNISKPTVDILSEIDIFAKTTKMVVLYYKKLAPTFIEDDLIGFMPFIFFINEIIGNEDKWNKQIDYWLRCGEVIVMKNKGVSNIKMIPKLGLNTDDKPNSLARIRRMIVEGNRLIEGSVKGTFPYSDLM